MEVFVHYLFFQVFPGEATKATLPARVDEILEDGRRNMLELIGLISERAKAADISLESIKLGTSVREMESRLQKLFIVFWFYLDIDEIETLLEACLVYLDRPSDDKAVTRSRLEDLMNILTTMEVQGSIPKAVQSADPSDEIVKTYKRCCQKVIAAIVGFSEASDFTEIVGWPPREGSTSEMLRLWILGNDSLTQQTACFMFGNMAVSDTMCIAMVRDGASRDAARLVIQSQDREVQYAAAGWLRHLAFPSAESHKKILLATGYLQAAQTLIQSSSDAQLCLAGLALLRRLLQDSLLSCQVFLGTVNDVEYTKGAYLPSLLTITDMCGSLDPKSPISLPLIEEGARIVVAVARCIVKSGSDESSPLAEERRRFFERGNVVELLLKALHSTTNEVVRSDCLFGLALMANCTQGASVVGQQLEPHVLESLLSSQSLKDPKESKDQEKLLLVYKKNLDNAMSINNGILKYAVS